MKLKLHVFNDGRCLLEGGDLSIDQMNVLRKVWNEWILSPEAHPLLIVNGVIETHDMVFEAGELKLVKEMG
jgi:hypothetical protein